VIIRVDPEIVVIKNDYTENVSMLIAVNECVPELRNVSNGCIWLIVFCIGRKGSLPTNVKRKGMSITIVLGNYI